MAYGGKKKQIKKENGEDLIFNFFSKLRRYSTFHYWCVLLRRRNGRKRSNGDFFLQFFK